MSFAQDLDDAAGAAICGWLANGGNAALTTVAISGALTPGGQVPALAAGLGILALNAGCAFDPNSGGASPVDGCYEASPGGWGYVMRRAPDGTITNELGLTRWESFSVTSPYKSGIYTVVDITAKEFGGGSRSYPELLWSPGTTFFLDIKEGTCAGTASPTDPVTLPPANYTSPTTNCTYIVEQQSWGMFKNGYTYPILKISAGPQQVRTDGGIIQGCNFDPVLYVGPPGGGGGGGTYIPWQDDPADPPWWLPWVAGLAGGVAGALTDELLEELFKKKVGEKVYRLVSVCETNDQGEPVSESREVSIPPLEWDKAIIWRLDALEYLLQGLKDFKQPICSRSKPVGDFVTVHFESDAPSIAGERPLRKYLRYRDQMASDLAAHAAHWENFSWEAGPVIVIHKNAPWGIVKVWAADADEGKRVIRHAGTISGINVDAEGEWLVTSSDDPRYGRTGTMRLGRRKSGQGMVLTISKRGGPDGLPIVPVDPLP